MKQFLFHVKWIISMTYLIYYLWPSHLCTYLMNSTGGGGKKKSQLKFVSRYNNRAKKHFNCFLMLFLFPIWHQISYQSIESSDPSINVPGPRRTVSKLKNETYHMFSNLHPGTTYLISVRARTAKGFGQTALTEITTNISGRSAAVGASVLSWATVRNLV